MSAIFGEMLTFGQDNGPDIRLKAFGDEFYARYENGDGFTALYDTDQGQFCYAMLADDRLVSTGVPVGDRPPTGLRRHLSEPESRRQYVYETTRARLMPPPDPVRPNTMRTFGPNLGLLNGRRLSSGTVRGLTIVVEFADVRTTVSKNDVSDLLNADNYTSNGNVGSVREYFRQISAEHLEFENDVVGPLRLSKPRSYYAQNLLVKEALDLAVASGVNLANYDSRNEGIVDSLSILYAGQTQYLGDLWPHNSFIDLRYGNMRTNLYVIAAAGRTPADLSIGTFCHEAGHMLCRFPDLYDYGNRDGDGVESAGIGMYCLMGGGSHLGRGRTPSPITGYLRDLAGWCESVTINSGGRFQATHGDYGTILKYETERLNEYFIIENRSRLGLDTNLPASGLAVFHCDTRGSNEWQEGSSTRHYQCALIQADGNRDLERNVNQGDGGDLYGLVSGVALSHATHPGTRLWDGSDSGLVVSDITTPDPIIQFTAGEAPAPSGPLKGEASPGLLIPDRDPAGVSDAIAIVGAGLVDSIAVTISIKHTWSGDLRLELVAPSGRSAILRNRVGGSIDDIEETFTSEPGAPLVSMLGQPVAGSWVLRVADLALRDVGRLERWAIEIEAT